MAKRNLYPKTKQQDLNLIHRTQTDFSGGEVKDIDPREIKGNEVTSLVNMRGYSDCARGRTGSIIYQNVDLPTRDDGYAVDSK